MRLGGCHNPSKMKKMLGVHFFEPLYPCEDKMSIKKVFHFLPSEIAASMHSQYGPSRLDRPHMLAAVTNGKLFLVRAASQQHVSIIGCMETVPKKVYTSP